MKIKDWPVVKEAKKAAIAQLAYYNRMMSIKTANEESVSQQYIREKVAEDMQPFYDAFKKDDKMTEPKQKVWPTPPGTEPAKKLFIVDTISTFRHRYVIEAKELEHAYDEVTMIDSGSDEDLFESVSQRYLGEVIVDGREITKKDFDKMLKDLADDKDEGCSFWMGDKLIRKIDYDR